MYGFPFINLIHDLWTSNKVEYVLGASISYIDSNFVKHYLALICRKHTLGHSTAAVSDNIKEMLIQEYTQVDIGPHVRAVVSDTTGVG